MEYSFTKKKLAFDQENVIDIKIMTKNLPELIIQNN